MNILQHTTNALATIASNKLRSGLTMLGIVIGVSSVIIMVAIGQGAQSSVTEKINQMGTHLLTVSSGGGGAGNVRSSGTRGITPTDAMNIKQYFGERVQLSPEVTTSKQVIAGAENTNANIRGVVADFPTIRNAVLEAGRFFTTDEAAGATRVAVLGHTIAETLFGTGTNPIGNEIRIGSGTFSIIGLLTDNSDTNNNIIIPLETAQLRLTGSKTYDSIVVSFGETEDMTVAAYELTHILAASRGVDPDDPDFRVINRSDFLSTLSSITQIFTVLLGGIAGISLVVGGIGVMNIMLVSVTERTREIGIRKAIGALPRDIMAQFLIEAVVLSAIGGVIGIGISIGVITLIRNVFSFSASLSITAIVFAFCFSAAVGVFFGYVPARRASRLHIIDALRYE